MPIIAATAKRKTTYTLTLEPHNQHYLFALDLPTRIYTLRSWGRHDHTWYRWRPITSRLRYEAVSQPSARPLGGSHDSRAALQLPEDGNEKSRQLAQRLRAESGSSTEYLDKLLTWFRTGNFSYTLAPQAIPPGKVGRLAGMDHFLFAGREGFCEHYASALAYLMRAGGVPARLVGGYLGGSPNPYGDYLVIRQSDAHVWCEVLLEDGKWHRVDPTVVVAPPRAAESAAEFLAVGESKSSWTLFGMLKTPQWFKPVSDYLDLLNSRWNLLVMGYSRPSQMRIFSLIGINLRLPGGMVKAGIIGLVLLASLLFMIAAVGKRIKTPQDKVAKYWLKFCAKVERGGINRLPHQGPMDYLQTIKVKRPDLANSASHIVNLYVALRFRKEHDTGSLKSFIQAVQTFSPSKKAKP